MMFFGAYHFAGSPATLLPAYHELMKTYPPGGPAVHACVVGEDGITVFDACPSRSDFEQFTRSEYFSTWLAEAGLPAPRIEALGEVHAAIINQVVPT
jgi:hypothetical protein